ncbi:hypothetical protein FACS1894186_7250 [Alphaproteobacteria bacterium]|nr:hypothetical protein FACS1894186_7250 [Alphaproteobacteria bacterium]
MAGAGAYAGSGKLGADGPALAREGARFRSGALMCAAGRMGGAEAVRELLAAGASPKDEGPDGWTALHYAAGHGDCESVGRLLLAGGEPNRLNHSLFGEFTPLMQVFFGGAYEPLEKTALLLAGGADPSISGPEGDTALGLLINRGAYCDKDDNDYKDELERTARLLQVAGARLSPAEAARGPVLPPPRRITWNSR